MVALMVAAGEMLQHALSLLGLSYQHHHFQERSEQAAPNDNQYMKRLQEMFTSLFGERHQCMRSEPRPNNSHLRA